jgi:dipeptidyl aminopeptidase/acylaminoacyl peptidase
MSIPFCSHRNQHIMVRVRPRTILKWLGIALIGYSGAVALLYVIQRDLLYFPRRTAHTTPVAAGLAAAEEVVLATPDGEQVITWHVPPQPGRSAILFFHGAGDILARRAPRFRTLVADGTGLVALSYRGYGGSTGLPSERGVLLDAAAAYEFAAARYAPERIVVWARRSAAARRSRSPRRAGERSERPARPRY